MYIYHNIYPITPPRVLSIISSTSQLPTFVISCTSSIVNDKLNVYKNVDINPSFDSDVYGRYIPNGINAIIFPNMLSLAALPKASLSHIFHKTLDFL